MQSASFMHEFVGRHADSSAVQFSNISVANFKDFIDEISAFSIPDDIKALFAFSTSDNVEKLKYFKLLQSVHIPSIDFTFLKDDVSTDSSLVQPENAYTRDFIFVGRGPILYRLLTFKKIAFCSFTFAAVRSVGDKSSASFVLSFM